MAYPQHAAEATSSRTIVGSGRLWAGGLAVVAGIVAPFISGAELSAKVAIAMINLVVVVAIW
jgi:hypothetical protein